jgi:glutamine---fructose-6-phosphate transaminase (isomerizing)
VGAAGTGNSRLVHGDGQPREHWRTSSTYREIRSQPAVWALVVSDHLRIERAAGWIAAHRPSRVVIVGCGSSFYLACAAACAFNELSRIPTIALPAGEAVTGWDQHVVGGGPTLLIAVSRSGATSEVLWAIDEHQQHGRGPVLGVTTGSDSPIVDACDEVVVLSEAAETSVVMTRSFSAMLLGLDAIALRLGGGELSSYEPLADSCDVVLAGADADIGTIAEEIAADRVFVLGSGAAYGVAREGALKLLEGSLTTAQAFQHLEFRHGPKAMVSAGTLVASLATREGREFEPALSSELIGYGASLIRSGIEPAAGHHIYVPPCPDAPSEALLHLPVLHLLTVHCAATKGLNPDQPPHLDAVVELARAPTATTADSDSGGRTRE